MKANFPVLFVIIGLGFTSAHADPWNDINNPALMDSGYEYSFAKLPLQADLAKKPWSETYWQTSLGSINLRWNLEHPQGFDYKTPSRDQVLHMSKGELATLSPSEKFDIYRGAYDFPLHKAISKFANPHVTWWKGLCNGWSMSAVQFNEPTPKEVKNADGVVIPFGASDIKGLLSYYAQMESGVDVTYVGGQCTKMAALFNSDACKDMNPGALHVILANQLGLKKEAFMMDRDPGPQIWNQPVYGYKSETLGSAPSKAAMGVLVKTTIYYTDELKKSLWTAANGTPQFSSNSMEVNYILDLDASGRIVGGTYVDKSDHPDLFWLPKSKVVIKDDFALLNTLLN